MNPKRNDSVSPARRAAFKILTQVETKGSYASVLIAALGDSDLSREDRALAQEIVLGTLRWQRSLDYFIERYSKRSIARFDPPVLIALRAGLYQLRYLTRIPPSAAVNESVKLVKRARVASAAPLVNAVLRKAAQHLDEPAGLGISDPQERAAIELSHPAWMLKRWEAQFDARESQLLALANNAPPTTAFRVNTLLTSVDELLSELERSGVETNESRVATGAFVVKTGPAATIIQAAQRGLLCLQDEASQLVSLLLEPGRGDRVLDLCAAPGSKTSHIAVLAGDEASILASDRHAHRLSALRETCERLGIRSVAAIALDATRELPLVANANVFDRVLVDAPCSGTGTLRGNPEIKWRLTADGLPKLAELQLKLLETGSSAVARGGRLVYSTCSIEPEENEAVVSRFLETTTRFEVIHPRAPSGLITTDGFVRTLPHRDGTDGFFAAVFERIR